MTQIIRIVALVLGLAAANAQAVFHLWSINELYSNADGTVQFCELRALAGGQQFVDGQSFTASGSAGTHSFMFGHDLPGDSSGKTMLIATQGFAALGIVTPDFTVPNGFFSQGGGTVNFANVDSWNHGALPTDNRSLFRDGSTAVNSPRNFAGQTGTVSTSTPAPPGINVQGLWYRGESESGWGVNVTHQGDILFVTWFTYETGNTQMWLVGPDFRKTTGNTYSGSLYRTTGPAFSANPFNPANIQITNVGTGTLAFTDANTGTFSYTVNGITQSKPIIRQVFSPTTPTCTANGTQSAVLNFQDLWYRGESESGWGVNVTHQGDILFVTWFTYDSTGKGMWVVGPAIRRTTGNTFAGAIYRTTGAAFSADPWNPALVGVTEVGTATFAFSDASNGTFTYTVNQGTSVTQTKQIVRQQFGTPPTVCRN